MMAEYKHLRNEVVTNIRKSQQDYYKKKISPDNKPQNIWKAVNESLGKDKKSKLPNDISPDSWNNHFTSVGPNLAKKIQIARIQLGKITTVSTSSNLIQ